MTHETPALFGESPPTHRAGVLREAVETTLAELEAAGAIDRRHAALGQLARILADAVEAGTRGRRASAAAMAARELRETLALLMPETTEGDGDEWDAWLRAIESDADAVVRGAEVRHSPES